MRLQIDESLNNGAGHDAYDVTCYSAGDVASVAALAVAEGV